jgi:hypothetical protein
MTPVEKVARAIAEAASAGAERWREHEDEARAAIEAMREPSEGMIRIGTFIISNQSADDHRRTAAPAFEAMIDAALAEDPGSP